MARRISVCIPTYNCAAYLAECLASIQAQTRRPDEILVLDDGSTDHTAEVAVQFPAVRYLYRPHRGVSAARNELIREASGDWIAFCDADDFWTPDKLASQEEYLDTHPCCRIVFCRYENFYESAETADSEQARRTFANHTSLPIVAALIDRQLFFEVKFFEEGLLRGEDTDFIVALKMAGIRLNEQVDRVLYRRRVRRDSLTVTAEPVKSDREYLANFAGHLRRNRGISKNTRRISVCIPSYNNGCYLEECLNGVFRQTVQPYEILVLDDGSTDQTPEVMAKFPTVRYLRRQHRGVSAARNELIREAAGDWIAFCDADDFWLPEKLALQNRYLDEHPDAPAVFCRYENFYENAEVAERKEARRTFAYADCWCLPTAVIRKTIFTEIKSFDETLPRAEDTDFMMALKMRGVDLSGYIEQVLYRRRIHHGSLTVEGTVLDKNVYFSGIAQLLRKNRNFRKKQTAPPTAGLELKPFSRETSLISVIIPAYNAEKFLAEALQSVFQQQFRLEVIVADDGSTDHTEQLARSFDTIFLKQEHRNAAAARNLGLSRAHGDFLLFLDADDLLLENTLEDLAAAFIETPGAWCVTGKIIDFKSSDADTSPIIVSDPYPGVLAGCALLRKEAFQVVGPFDETLPTGETVDWMLRCRTAGLATRQLDRLLCRRRIHDRNTTAQVHANHIGKRVS